MYLFIFEDGEIKKAKSVCKDDFDCVDAGILSLIDLSGDEPKEYFKGEWHDLKILGE